MENPIKNGGFWGPISGNLRKPPCFPTSAAARLVEWQLDRCYCWCHASGSWASGTLRRYGVGVPRCRDVGNMGENWQRSALHSNFDHIVHIISYHIISYIII